MCREAICKRCQKLTWTGCGQHKDAILRNIPMKNRCTCQMKGEKMKQENNRSEAQQWINQSYPR